MCFRCSETECGCFHQDGDLADTREGDGPSKDPGGYDRGVGYPRGKADGVISQNTDGAFVESSVTRMREL